MPGLAVERGEDRRESSAAAAATTTVWDGSGFWSKHWCDVGSDQLQKFWGELSPQARRDLLRIDKQTLFEQARKNMYCSRCNGLLLEAFMQIFMYGKSLLQEGAGGKLPCNRNGISQSETFVPQDELQEPAVHPWGGLTTTRDGALTVLDCYLHPKSLKGLQNVFDSARARDRERELLYPDACGGGGRGWISQGFPGYGRGHGTRETCALHTARLSCDTLVDFWSALGEETRQSLLRMREEDFIERLMHRFESKRFCRDCRRNVIREFKELKELKRLRIEPRCTNWFCAADTDFLYEVSNDTIHADWHLPFIDSIGTYKYFEWAVGSAEGKSDILEFEDVGMNGSAVVNGLDLEGLGSIYITLRAWKFGGRNTELCVKAYPLKGHQCVHSRLIVGDGYVSIMRGDSIRKFFEHAEEVEEEEDDDSMDKDGNDLDGECSRPQKHAKSPELAREFLLDAATVIFKEQVEKAFREGTARQNAHSIFVCLSLKLLEERVHVACKEIITLEKQMKLLEEEEKEKRDEEERRERKRTKEKEKKLRRKERMKGKDKEKKCAELNHCSDLPLVVSEAPLPCIDEKPSNGSSSCIEAGDATVSQPTSPVAQYHSSSIDCTASDSPTNSFDSPEDELADVNSENDSFSLINSKASRHLKSQREFQPESPTKWNDRRGMDNLSVSSKSESRCHEEISERCIREMNGLNRPSRTNGPKFNPRSTGGQRYSVKMQVSSSRNDPHFCGCNQHSPYRTKVEPNVSTNRLSYDTRSLSKCETASELPKIVQQNSKSIRSDGCGRSRSKISTYSNFSRDPFHTKKVWEPVEPQKKYPRSNSDSDVTLRLHGSKDGVTEPAEEPFTESGNKPHRMEMQSNQNGNKSNGTRTSAHFNEAAVESSAISDGGNFSSPSDFSPSSSSSSDNCSSCTSEGDNATASLNPLVDSSSTSDSEDSSHPVEESKTLTSGQNRVSGDREVGTQRTVKASGEGAASLKAALPQLSSGNTGSNTSHPLPNSSAKPPRLLENDKIAPSVGALHHGVIPPVHHQNAQFPVFQVPSTVGYYHQNPVSWSAASANGFVPYHQPNNYLFTTPLGLSYGLTGDSHLYMQYGAMQPLADPLLHSGQVPVYQPFLRANDSFHMPVESNLYEANRGAEQSPECRREKVVPAGHSPTETPLRTDVQKVKSSDLKRDTAGFSLFQFYGLGSLSRNKAYSDSSSEGLPGVASGNCNADHNDGDCRRKTDMAIEEYNLFATNNGIKFSIF